MDPANERSIDSKEHIEETILYLSPQYAQDRYAAASFFMFHPCRAQAQALAIDFINFVPQVHQMPCLIFMLKRAAPG
jgi:hypothetical protein